jgi:c(7)-type cytochrome triheme protein
MPLALKGKSSFWKIFTDDHISELEAYPWILFKMRSIKLLSLTFLFFALILGSGSAVDAENKGAEEILLNGGTSGPVPFPHQRHQEIIGDCMVCHSLFPQQSRAIDELKRQEKLAKKQVMNQSCTQCHRAKQAAGESKYGPITCSQCHRK